MGAEVKRLTRKHANGWQRVTNALVVEYADPDCHTCKGLGVMGTRTEPQGMCKAGCFDKAFKKEFEGRLRRTKEGRLEYRPLTIVKLEDGVSVVSPGGANKLIRRPAVDGTPKVDARELVSMAKLLDD